MNLPAQPLRPVQPLRDDESRSRQALRSCAGAAG
jgi:hypothetical protein